MLGVINPTLSGQREGHCVGDFSSHITTMADSGLGLGLDLGLFIG